MSMYLNLRLGLPAGCAEVGSAANKIVMSTNRQRDRRVMRGSVFLTLQTELRGIAEMAIRESIQESETSDAVEGWRKGGDGNRSEVFVKADGRQFHRESVGWK